MNFNTYYRRCVRTQQWEAMKVWNSRNITAESVVDEHKVAATITALKKIEGLLILYGNKVDEYLNAAVYMHAHIYKIITKFYNFTLVIILLKFCSKGGY